MVCGIFRVGVEHQEINEIVTTFFYVCMIGYRKRSSLEREEDFLRNTKAQGMWA